MLSVRALAVVGACLCWGIDNNLTRRVSASDPVFLAMVKGLVAGSANTALALAMGVTFPAGTAIAGAMLLGFFSYGISLVLFIYGLRHLGSARAGAHYSTAPFIGAAIAWVLFPSPMSVQFAVALTLMIISTWLVLTGEHGHMHKHERMAHSHEHYRDDHHGHSHDGMEVDEPHTHEHIHEPTSHNHGHLPDIHHRHSH